MSFKKKFSRSKNETRGANKDDSLPEVFEKNSSWRKTARINAKEVCVCFTSLKKNC